jgi:hypothetical protein
MNMHDPYIPVDRQHIEQFHDGGAKIEKLVNLVPVRQGGYEIEWADIFRVNAQNRTDPSAMVFMGGPDEQDLAIG